ncbi:MAG: hypothetical protein H0W87_08705, partial [Actinobacteria bacterium]|nr:hypothetical protein [Actinomycetota bacterium]
MARIRLVHWHPGEGKERAADLRSLGHEVDASPVTSGTIRDLPRSRADAFVVDLTRLPSQGRDVGVSLRRSKTSRHV